MRFRCALQVLVPGLIFSGSAAAEPVVLAETRFGTLVEIVAPPETEEYLDVRYPERIRYAFNGEVISEIKARGRADVSIVYSWGDHGDIMFINHWPGSPTCCVDLRILFVSEAGVWLSEDLSDFGTLPVEVNAETGGVSFVLSGEDSGNITSSRLFFDGSNVTEILGAQIIDDR